MNPDTKETKTQKLTDVQEKVLTYVRKRKNPVTAKQVWLQTKVGSKEAQDALRHLAYKGYIKSFKRVENLKQDRFYSFLTDTPEPRPKKQRTKPIASNFFNNPFGLGVRNERVSSTSNG